MSPTPLAAEPTEQLGDRVNLRAVLRAATADLHAHIDRAMPLARSAPTLADYLTHLLLLRDWLGALGQSMTGLNGLADEQAAVLADAEQAAANQRRQPHPARAGVDRIGGLDPACRGQRAKANHRHAGRQCPLAQARGVARGHHVGDGAHGAVARAVHDGAKQHRERKRAPQHGGGHLVDIWRGRHGARFY